MAETLTAPSAASVVAEETFEIDLPEDEDIVAADKDADSTTEDTDEPEVKKVTTEKPVPEATAEKKAEPEKAEPQPKPQPKVETLTVEEEPAPERERLSPAAREERNKRKQYAQLYAQAKEQLDAAERRIRLLTTQPDGKDPNLKKWHDDLAAEASKATDLADVFRLAVREMDRRDRARATELNANLYQMQCDISQARAESAHKDWNEVVTKAGLFEAIVTDAQGNFKDPAIAKRVYYNVDGTLAADPAERMYRLAVGKLEYEKSLKGETDEDGDHAAEPKKPAVKKADEPKAEVVVEAERRGAQRVVEQVSKNSTRLKGIRSLPKAGEGPTRMSKAQLDTLMNENPAAYTRLLERNPDLERWHLG